jgi:hypothetical protein
VRRRRRRLWPNGQAVPLTTTTMPCHRARTGDVIRRLLDVRDVDGFTQTRPTRPTRPVFGRCQGKPWVNPRLPATRTVCARVWPVLVRVRPSGPTGNPCQTLVVRIILIPAHVVHL